MQFVNHERGEAETVASVEDGHKLAVLNRDAIAAAIKDGKQPPAPKLCKNYSITDDDGAQLSRMIDGKELAAKKPVTPAPKKAPLAGAAVDDVPAA